MLGYKPIFESAQDKALDVNYWTYFPTFHDHPEIFHFIMAPPYLNFPDWKSLNLAKELDYEIYNSLLLKGPSLLGNGSDQLDCIESRHILLMTYLIQRLGKDWGDVIEIGGGYGNCVRLVNNIVTFNKWSIIDLEYISELQNWFINISCPNLNNVKFIYSDFVRPMVSDLVIGTHSLSEFGLEDFNIYYDLIIRNTTWFYYVSQESNPSVELLEAKQRIISNDFDLQDRLVYEEGSSIIHLFRRKE